MSLKYEVHRENTAIKFKRHGKYHNIGGPSLVSILGEVWWSRYGKLYRYKSPGIE